MFRHNSSHRRGEILARARFATAGARFVGAAGVCRLRGGLPLGVGVFRRRYRRRAFGIDVSDYLADLDLALLLNGDFEGAGAGARNGEGRLVGLELEDLVAFFDAIPRLLQPRREDPSR